MGGEDNPASPLGPDRTKKYVGLLLINFGGVSVLCGDFNLWRFARVNLDESWSQVGENILQKYHP